MNRRRPWAQGFLLLVFAAPLLSACTTRRIDSGALSSMGPTLTVEQFLQAANDQNLDTMARMFGTADGPIADGAGNSFGCFFKKIGDWIGVANSCLKRTDIELRMNAIAMILRHDDYRIVSEGVVAGREDPTTRIGVNLTIGERQYPDVPFLVVQTSDDGWLVEEIGLTEITGR